MKTGKACNGLEYAIRKNNGSAVAYCSLSIRCGTRDEGKFPEGIAHFTEHTIFKGTRSKSSSVINNYLDRLGGELNAYTTKEEIVVHATVLKEDIEKAASLLMELASQATFPQKEIDLEKGVVIDEIASCKDVPSEDIYDRFEALLFAGHPLSRMILGTKASVLSITQADLLAFTSENFVPWNMAFTVVADENESKMEKMILKLSDSFFPQKQAPVDNSDRRIHQEPAPNLFEKTIGRRHHQVNAIIGSTAPSLYNQEGRICAILLCNILGGPATNSILNSILREKHGWVYGVECNYTQYADTGIVSICLGCDKENLDKCLETIDKEILKLQENLLTPARLKAAKRQLLGQLAISSDNGEAQCLSMGKSLLAYACVRTSEENKAMIEAVSAEDIQKMARSIFAKDHLSKLIYL